MSSKNIADKLTEIKTVTNDASFDITRERMKHVKFETLENEMWLRLK